MRLLIFAPPLITFIMVCLVFPVHTQAEQRPLWLSAAGQQPPRLYLFWQAGWTPKTKPEHIRLVSQNPPDLFQYPTHELSSGLPHGSMCPAPAEHKIRWSYEKEEPAAKPANAKPAWWTTEEYAQRVADDADAVKWVMQQTGAHGLAPYVCAVKIEGERDKRLRFWAFYDRWDLYRQWFGPKPASDPWDWVQFRPDYNAKSMWGFYKPADDGSRIHSGCPNSPFSAYLASLVKIGAQNGLRAVFVDNPGCNCICPHCEAAWQDFLRQRFTKEELNKYFGVADYADAKLTDKRFEIERKRFWGHSAGKHLARLREAGESVLGKGNFWICPNGASIEFVPSSPGCDAVEWAKVGGFQLGSRENNRMSEGFERTRLGQNLYFNATNDLILGHKMMRGLSSHAWAAPLRSHEFLGRDEGFYNLATAETLAFDGVLCDTGAPWFPTTARKPFYDFYRGHESLLRSGQSVAEVGVLCFTNELHLDPADSVRELRLVTDWLSEANVLWDAVMDDNLAGQSLGRYKTVFVPNVRMLDDREVDALLAYARAGGRLILSGEVGTSYRCGVKRPKPAFASALPKADAGKGFAVSAHGSGKLAYCPRGFADVDVPDAYTGTDVHCEQPARSLIRETNRKTFLACLDEAAGEGLSAILSPGPRAVRMAARWFADGPQAVMTVHLANYDLRMRTADQSYYRVLREPSKLTPATSVHVVVPLPAGYKTTAISWAELPDPRLKPVEFKALRGGVRFTIPRVASYSFAAVTLAKGETEGPRMADERGTRTSADGALPTLETEGKASALVYAAQPAPLKLDHVLHVAPGTPVIVSGTKEQDLEIRLDRPGQKKPDVAVWSPMKGFDVSADAERGEVRWLRFWLIGPSAVVAASGAVPADQSTLIKVPAAETGLYALMTEAGLGSLAVSANGRGLMATGQPLRFEDPDPKLFFFVPKGLKELQITSGGLDYKMHLKVFDAAGGLRFQRDDFNVHHKSQRIAVPPGQDGKVWIVTLVTETPEGKRAGRRTQIELAPPLTGFVSPDPARLAVFE